MLALDPPPRALDKRDSLEAFMAIWRTRAQRLTSNLALLAVPQRTVPVTLFRAHQVSVRIAMATNTFEVSGNILNGRDLCSKWSKVQQRMTEGSVAVYSVGGHQLVVVEVEGQLVSGEIVRGEPCEGEGPFPDASAWGLGHQEGGFPWGASAPEVACLKGKRRD